jgi:hypothetical protein
MMRHKPIIVQQHQEKQGHNSDYQLVKTRATMIKMFDEADSFETKLYYASGKSLFKQPNTLIKKSVNRELRYDLLKLKFKTAALPKGPEKDSLREFNKLAEIVLHFERASICLKKYEEDNKKLDMYKIAYKHTKKALKLMGVAHAEAADILDKLKNHDFPKRISSSLASVKIPDIHTLGVKNEEIRSQKLYLKLLKL